MALSVPEKIAQVAEHIARHNAHGYSQNNRKGDGTRDVVTLSDGSKVTIHGGDYDCSEMDRVCVNCALTGSDKGPITFMWTGNADEELRANSFKRMGFSSSKVRRGDVLWMPGHMGIALGNGRQADAHGDEYGGITGPNSGDQTGHEVEVRDLRGSWTYIYRHAGSAEAVPPFVACSFAFTAAAECNVRSAPTTADKANVTGQLKPGERVYCDGIVPANGHIWGTYIANSGKRRYVSIGTQHSWAVVP